MNTPIPNQIIREITPLSDKDCFYIAERYKTEFTYPIHNHSEFELNFTEKAAGVRRVVGDSSEVIGDYDGTCFTHLFFQAVNSTGIHRKTLWDFFCIVRFIPSFNK